MEEIEQRLERGEFFTGVPAETLALEVAFDPANREQVIAFPADDGGGGGTLIFSGAETSS